jgi:hypothetical protein
MGYIVLSNTVQEIAAGASHIPTRLGERLVQQMVEFSQAQRTPAERCDVEVYFMNSFIDHEEFAALRNRFGGNPMQFLFLNECAVRACEHFNIPINAVGTVDQLPPRTGLALRNLFIS